MSSRRQQIGAGPGEGPQNRIVAVLGPTNTGKTHFAVERMLAHESGMIGLPLRLLAREVYDRICQDRPARDVALITGEEKIVPPRAKYFVCTVEAMPVTREVAFLAIDEIQLAADPERGHVFTDRLLYARGWHETMFLGSETIRHRIKSLVPKAEFITRSRFSHLSYAGSKKISRLPRRTAIVAFSADAVYTIAELIRRQRGGAAVVLGSLSPRTRNAQVELYQSGEVDYMVATDAIGMGLNMDVDHVAFAGTRKFDGHSFRELRAAEMAQIAGRAGRYMNDGTFGTTGDAGLLDDMLIEQIEEHRFRPLETLQYRNSDLQYHSVQKLLHSLEEPAPRHGLIRARPADDLMVLQAFSKNPDFTTFTTSPAAVKTMWNVCQVPDFRKVTSDEHASLLSNIYSHLMSHNSVVDEDWLSGHVDRMDRTDGDLDTLSNRIAHMRTWTFVSNRPDWLDDPEHWQERTRAIEDKLSDALHERLTQRFIDRRTSLLIKRLKDNEALMAAINQEGEVTVEGEFVGRLNGFCFVPDPRVQASNALEGKALRAAATKALEPEIVVRAAALVAANDADIELRSDGTIWWQNGLIARLLKGDEVLSPKIELLTDNLMAAPSRDGATAKLNTWFNDHLESQLGSLALLRKAVTANKEQDGVLPVTGLARGIGYQMVENLGYLDRQKVADDVKSLDQPARSQLRKQGVRFGEFSIFMPDLLKPAAARLLVILRAIADDRQKDGHAHEPVQPGLTSVASQQGISFSYYIAAGFRRCGRRAVRIDMLERLANLIREQKADTNILALDKVVASAPVEIEYDPSIIDWRLVVAGPGALIDDGPIKPRKPKIKKPRGSFEITPDMMSLVGCSGDDFIEILSALGYRKLSIRQKQGEDLEFWRAHAPGQNENRQNRHKNSRRNQKPNQTGNKESSKDGKKHSQGAKRRNEKRSERKPDHRPQRSKPPEKVADPNSPFAVLKSLTEKNE